MPGSRIGFAILFAGVVGFWATAAEAVTVSGSYQGHVTLIDAPLAGQFTLGEAFTLDFTYGTTGAIDTSPGLPNLGTYDQVFATFTGTIGSYSFALNGQDQIDVNIATGGFASTMTFLTQVSGVPIPSNDFPSEVDLVLYDAAHTALTDDSLPAAFLPGALFSKNSYLAFTVYNNGQAAGIIAALDRGPTATPVPPAGLLLLSALGGLGMLGWRRAKADRA